jgi:excisionase family DNA binding protein
MSNEKAAGGSSIQEKMRAVGYITVYEAAKRIGCDAATIMRWADSGDIRSIRAMERKRFVAVSDLALKVGLEASVMIGLITAEQAKQLRDRRAASSGAK